MGFATGALVHMGAVSVGKDLKEYKERKGWLK